jgi:hypothetical protein
MEKRRKEKKRKDKRKEKKINQMLCVIKITKNRNKMCLIFVNKN